MPLNQQMFHSPFMMGAYIISTCTCVTLAASVGGAHEFLARDIAETDPSNLLFEIDDLLEADYRKMMEHRLSSLKGELSPTLLALYRNEHGNYGHAAVRFALHRFFVQRHGWSIRGLEPTGEAWNASSPTKALRGSASEDIQSLFEARLGSHGLTLDEVAMLAAILENMAREEAVSRLEGAYRVLDLQIQNTSMDLSDVDRVLDLYMASYILGKDLATIDADKALKYLSRVGHLYPGWNATQVFVREVRAATLPAASSFNFDHVQATIDTVGDKFGHFQNRECHELKGDLLSIHDDGTGRVPLSKFYNSALHGGNWQFSESIAYLRQLGALDEDDPDFLSVIIPNYVSGPSNCIASSKYYSVCCLNECEGLLGHLERELEAPDAAPSQIVQIVSTLSSATVLANRTLPTTLVNRLIAIAETHGGRVPLHGRLFAQWMHHAYPRECPYPHISGTTAPVRSENYHAEAEGGHLASKDEMRQFIEVSPRRQNTSGLEDNNERECAQWHHEEELFIPRLDSRPTPSSWRAVSQGLALCGIAGSSVFMILQMLTSVGSAVAANQNEANHKPARTVPAGSVSYSV